MGPPMRSLLVVGTASMACGCAPADNSGECRFNLDEETLDTGRVAVRLESVHRYDNPAVRAHFSQSRHGGRRPGEGDTRGVGGVRPVHPLKHVWRLNMWWIGGILAASLWALSFVYGAMEFLLHWTF